MKMLPAKSPPANGQTEGERKRDAALSILLVKRAAIVRRLQRAAVMIALDIGMVTADDVREVVLIPPEINPKVNGAAIYMLAELGIFRGGVYIRSSRPIAHARPIRRWHLADITAAMQWLASNPEYPEQAA